MTPFIQQKISDRPTHKNIVAGRLRPGDYILHQNSSTPCVVTNELTVGTGFVHVVSLNGSFHKVKTSDTVTKIRKDIATLIPSAGRLVIRKIIE